MAHFSYLPVLKNRNFLKVLISQAISNLGDWIIIVPLIDVIYRLTGSGLAVATLMMAKILPAIFWGPVSGVLIDRLNRQRTMIVSDLGRGFLILLLPFVRNIYQIYLVVFLMEAFSLTFTPAKNASLPNIVKKEDLTAANSLSTTTYYLSWVVGVSFGSTILYLVDSVLNRVSFLKYFSGSQTAFLLDSSTFFASALLVALVSFPSSTLSQAGKGVNFNHLKKDLREGFELIRKNPLTRLLLINGFFVILGAGSLYSLGVIYTSQVLKVGSHAFGYLLAILGLGSLFGALSVGFFEKFFQRKNFFILSQVCFGLSLTLFASLRFYEAALLASFIGGMSLAWMMVTGHTLLQERVEDKMRGRVFSVFESFLKTAILATLALSGVLSDFIGEKTLSLGDYHFRFQGAQTTLFLGGLIVMGASLFSYETFKRI